MSEYEEQQVALSARWAAPNREAIAAHCRARRISLASHDDATAAHVAESCALGSAIAEFPTTEAAARASHQQGLQVLMGAPNIVRGGSHSGTWRRTTGGAGVLDILSSDYYPASLLDAAFRLAADERNAYDLPQAVRMITRNPARALDLQDRGTLAEGLRADLVLARPHGEHVYVQNVAPGQAGVLMARLIYLMGPSGAGKDSLLAALRADADSAPLVAHRYITRPADAGCENHIALSEPEFLRRRAKGLFALDWQAHQQHYAFGIEVDLWLLQDRRGGQRFARPPAAGAAALWCAAAAGVSAGQRRDPAPAPAGSRARKRRTDRAAAGAGGGISAESARRLPGAAQRWPTRRHPGGAAGAAAYRHPTSSGRDAMNDFAQPKIGDNVTLNRTRLGQYVHLADDAILEEVEMGTTPTPPGTTRSFTPLSASSSPLLPMRASIPATTRPTSASRSTTSPIALPNTGWGRRRGVLRLAARAPRHRRPRRVDRP